MESVKIEPISIKSYHIEISFSSTSFLECDLLLRDPEEKVYELVPCTKKHPVEINAADFAFICFQLFNSTYFDVETIYYSSLSRRGKKQYRILNRTEDNTLESYYCQLLQQLDIAFVDNSKAW